jgi:hypothetical protein
MTIMGVVVGLVSLLLFLVLVNAFYPLIVGFFPGTDPTFQLIVNIGVIAVGLAVILGIWTDATHKNQVQ